MQRRTEVAELLDGRLDDTATLTVNLRDLRRVNRWLGGVRLSADGIDALAAHRPELTVIDIGTGGADIPLALLERARTRRRGLTIVGIDNRPEVLAAAPVANPAVATAPGLKLYLGDGRSLPYPDRSFDVAHVSMVVHHLAPDAAVELLREMARVSRLGVVVNDLDRSRLGWIGAWLLSHLLTSNRFTQHDAPLSVQRAYRAEEMAAMLRQAGLTPVRTLRGAFGQRYAIAALPAAPPIEASDGPPYWSGQGDGDGLGNGRGNGEGPPDRPADGDGPRDRRGIGVAPPDPLGAGDGLPDPPAAG
jgi:ubiquinone/menaquinone biosynthesis C-methylase UbiE